MPVFYDLRKDIRFKEGVEVGIKKGIEKGRLTKARFIAIPYSNAVYYLLKK